MTDKKNTRTYGFFALSLMASRVSLTELLLRFCAAIKGNQMSLDHFFTQNERPLDDSTGGCRASGTSKSYVYELEKQIRTPAFCLLRKAVCRSWGVCATIYAAALTTSALKETP